MAFIAKSRIRWNEPEAFRQDQDRLQAAAEAKLWWFRPTCVLFFTMATEFIRLANEHLRKQPLDLVFGSGICFGGSCLIIYGLPWLFRQLPASVSIYSNGIIMKMGQNQGRRLKEMTGFNWSTKNSYFVLHLVAKKGYTLSYGVPDPMTREKIEAVLYQCGLTKISTLVNLSQRAVSSK